MPESHPFAHTFKDPDAVSGQEPVAVTCHEPDSLSRYEPNADSGREPDSVALAGHLPEQAVAVGLDDVSHRHCHLPPGRAFGGHSHLDDIRQSQVGDAGAVF
jgi:hypothetical protein